jgi:hypothetical protein
MEVVEAWDWVCASITCSKIHGAPHDESFRE